METTTAILINRHRLTETSLIVHWCSADEGLFKTVAKGALRPKSSFAGALDLFITAEIGFTRSMKSDLHTLKESRLTDPRLDLRGSYARVIAATCFCKMIEMVAEREAPLGGLHDLLKLSLDYLSTHEPTPRLLERFEDRLCEELGLAHPSRHAAEILQHFLHRALPLQRAELLRHFAANMTSVETKRTD